MTVIYTLKAYEADPRTRGAAAVSPVECRSLWTRLRPPGRGDAALLQLEEAEPPRNVPGVRKALIRRFGWLTLLWAAAAAVCTLPAQDITNASIALEKIAFSFTDTEGGGGFQGELPTRTFLPDGTNVYEVPAFISTKTRFLTVNPTVSFTFTNAHPTANRSAFPRCTVVDEDPVGGAEQNEDLNGDGIPGLESLVTGAPLSGFANCLTGGGAGDICSAAAGETETVASVDGKNDFGHRLVDRSTIFTYQCTLRGFVPGMGNVDFATSNRIVVNQVLQRPDSLSFTTVNPEPVDPLSGGSIQQGAAATLAYTLRSRDDAQVVLKLVNEKAGGAQEEVITPLFMDVIKADEGTVSFDITDFVVPDEGSLLLKADLVAPDGSVLASATDVIYEIAVDLTIDHVEVVQVIQTADNAIPLVANKTTVIRPFTKIKAGPDEIRGVRVDVHAFRNGAEIADSPWRRVDASRIISSKNPSRDNTFHAHNLTLPAHWTQEGELNLRVVVNMDRSTPEEDFSNNEMELTVRFVAGKPFAIRYLPVCLAIPGLAELCPSPDVARVAGLVPKLFPLAERDFSYRGLNVPDTKLDELLFDADPVETQARRVRFKSRLNRLYELAQAHLVSFDQLIAWLPRGVGGRTLLGTSDPTWFDGNGRVTVGFDRRDRSITSLEITLAHEMSHNLGLRHPATRDSCGSRDSGTDWPYGSHWINEYGYDPRGRLKRPQTHHDLMSYCSPVDAWISDFHYLKLMNGMLQPQPLTAHPERAKLQDEEEQNAPPRNQEGPETVLMVSGTVDRDSNTGRLEEVYQFVSGAARRPSDSAGSTCLRFSGEAGVISDYCFDLGFRDPETDEAFSEDTFTVVTPPPAGTTRLALLFNDLELASRAASPAPPVVAITSPNAGETWDAAADGTVTWTANDPDGDSLLYSLLYSSDNGTSWLPLAIDLTEPTHTFSPALIQGGDQVHFRVIASDGFNSSEAQQGPITVTQQPEISPAQDPVDLGKAIAGDLVSGQVVLANTGTGPLEVDSVTSDRPEFKIVFPQGPFSIRAGSSASVEVSYEPSAPETQFATLLIASNASNQPQLSVQVRGMGDDGQSPILRLDSTVVDFAAVEVGETRSAGLVGRNASLVEMAISWSIEGPGFALGTPATTASVAAGEEFEIALTFTGAQPGEAVGRLTLTSDDPDRAAVDVALVALTLPPLDPGAGPGPQVNAGGVVLSTGTPVVSEISPSSISTVFGRDFAPPGTLALQAVLDADGRVSTNLADTCVEINGALSPIFAVLPNQINLQVPEGVSAGTASLAVIRGCGTANAQRSAPQDVTVASVSPAFFNFVNNADGQNPIAALHGGGPDLAGPAGLLPGVVTTPARPGEFVSLFATGLGPTNPIIEAGVIPGAVAPISGQVSATIGGIALAEGDIFYVGVAPCCAGLYQLVLKVPGNAPGGNLPVVVTVNGVSTAPGPFLAVQSP